MAYRWSDNDLESNLTNLLYLTEKAENELAISQIHVCCPACPHKSVTHPVYSSCPVLDIKSFIHHVQPM